MLCIYTVSKNQCLPRLVDQIDLLIRFVWRKDVFSMSMNVRFLTGTHIAAWNVVWHMLRLDTIGLWNNNHPSLEQEESSILAWIYRTLMKALSKRILAAAKWYLMISECAASQVCQPPLFGEFQGLPVGWNRFSSCIISFLASRFGIRGSIAASRGEEDWSIAAPWQDAHNDVISAVDFDEIMPHLYCQTVSCLKFGALEHLFRTKVYSKYISVQ